jgi:hypothetical protein
VLAGFHPHRRSHRRSRRRRCHRRLRRQPARETGIRRSLVSSHQRRKRLHRLTVRHPRRHRRVRRRLPIRVTCRLRLHRRRPIPAARCPPTARTCGRRPLPCRPGRRALLRRCPTRHRHRAHRRPTPPLAPVAVLHTRARRVPILRRRHRPSSRHPRASQARRLWPARVELWRAQHRQTQRHESDCSASSMRWPDKSRGLHGLPAIVLTIRPSCSPTLLTAGSHLALKSRPRSLC